MSFRITPGPGTEWNNGLEKQGKRLSRSMDSLDTILHNLEELQVHSDGHKVSKHRQSMTTLPEKEPEVMASPVPAPRKHIRRDRSVDEESPPIPPPRGLGHGPSIAQAAAAIANKSKAKSKANPPPPPVRKSSIRESVSSPSPAGSYPCSPLSSPAPYPAPPAAPQLNNEAKEQQLHQEDMDRTFKQKAASPLPTSPKRVTFARSPTPPEPPPRKKKAASGPEAPPFQPTSDDVFVEMLYDWDVYESHWEGGRIFYHNPTTGETSWKPPRRAAPSPGPKRDVAAAGVFSFKPEDIDDSAESPVPAILEEDEDDEDEDDPDFSGTAHDDLEERTSIVRDSIRCSNESDVIVPPGYTELYDKTTGHIYYMDNVQGILWYTTLDNQGKLYYYTKTGNKSEWELPPVPSIFDENTRRKAQANADADAPVLRSRRREHSQQLAVLRKGIVYRKIRQSRPISDAASGGSKAKARNSTQFAANKKWSTNFAVLSEGYLLFFNDELGFRRMGNTSPDTDRNATPNLCLDLSHCTLRWLSRGKRNNVLELRSSTQGLDLNLHWPKSDFTEASSWFHSLKEFTKVDSELGTATNELDPSLVSPATSASNKDAASSRQSFLPRLSGGLSAPGTGSVAQGSSSARSSIAPLEISQPLNVVKATKEDILAQFDGADPHITALLSSKIQDKHVPVLGLEAAQEKVEKQKREEAAALGQDRNFPRDDLDLPRAPRRDKHPSGASVESEPPPTPHFKKSTKLGRSGISKSFRKMADAVTMRPKKDSTDGGLSPHSRLERTPSRRSQFLSRFLDSKASEADRRKSKDELMKRGIYKREAVFGNSLIDMARDTHTGMPVFLVKCIKRLEQNIETVGIYRINGDAAVVQKIRLEIDKDNYKMLESTKDVSLLASSLKLFFRELPEPLIPKVTRNLLFSCAAEDNVEVLVQKMRKAVAPMETFSYHVLAYLCQHLAKVAAAPNNKMDAKNLATVFSPNLVHSVTAARRPESIISEMELNNVIVELLIRHVHAVFPKADEREIK